MTPLTEYPEIVLQRAVTYALANPATIWYSTDGIPFQVLSPGFIAHHGGPGLSVNGIADTRRYSYW